MDSRSHPALCCARPLQSSASSGKEMSHLLQCQLFEALCFVWMLLVCRVGQNHIYKRCIYVIFAREITQHTVYIYSSGLPYLFEVE